MLLALLAAQAAQTAVPAPAPGLDLAPNLALAQRAASAAIAACQGTPIAFAIIDTDAQPRLLVVGDGARSLFGNFAIRKAATALRFGKPSAEVRDAAKADPALAEKLKSDPALIGFGGGLPFAGGALAVAGAPSQDLDQTCASAARAVLAKG